MPFISRKPTRIPHYDYATPNYYFITICTHEKQCIFGAPGHLNASGEIARDCIQRIENVFYGVKVDKFVVMPNHIHAIMILESKEIKIPAITTVIGQYKAAVTKQIRRIMPEKQVWQRSFHDHIIRNQQSYTQIWEYIENNPKKWEEDCFYQG